MEPENDWHGRGGGGGRFHDSRASRRSDHGDAAVEQISHQSRQSIVAAFRPAVFDDYVATLDIPSLVQALTECGREFRENGRRPAIEKTDHRHRRLLRARRERPRSRAADERDEIAALHSITSSARSRIEVGSSTPIALAVVVLMTSSNLVGNSTGRSAAGVPF